MENTLSEDISDDTIPSREQFDTLIAQHINFVEEKKRGSIPISRQEISEVEDVLFRPKYTGFKDKSFRAWVKRMFQIRVDEAGESGVGRSDHYLKPPVASEGLYDIITE